MGLDIDIIVRDSDLLARLNDAETVVIPREQEDAIGDILSESITRLQKYPPETDANKPPPPYYIRGVGNIGRGGTVTKPSENLKEQWSYEVDADDQSVTGALRNLASYSALVHGETLQAPFHAARGWPIAVDVVADVAGEERASTSTGAGGKRINIQRRIENAIKRIFG